MYSNRSFSAGTQRQDGRPGELQGVSRTVRYRLSQARQSNRRSVYLLPVLLDRELASTPDGGGGESVLSLPLGTSSVLENLLRQLARHRHRTTLVVSTGGAARYQRWCNPSEPDGYRVITPAQLAEVFTTCETTDYLAFVHLRYWPSLGHQFGNLAGRLARFRGALHAIALPPTASAAWEQIVCDAAGQVRRVQRLYDTMSWPDAAASWLLYSLVPAHVLSEEDADSPMRLRSRLAARGVLTQDVPLDSSVHDLTDPAGILSLSEQAIQDALRRRPRDGYVLRGPEVLVGRDCRIHPSVRPVGPVVIQQGVTIEEGAQIVGPAVLGAGSRVRRGAIVNGSLLGFGATAPPRAIIAQQVLLADGRQLSGAGGSNGWSVRRESAYVVRSDGKGDQHPRPVPVSHRRGLLGRAAKRALDVAGASIGLILLSPLFLLVAALIKLTSPGRVFFVHQRERMGGVEFPCVKFRSMVEDAHLKQRELYGQSELDGPQFKLRCDPRETTVGRWLRRTNIDELPQLFNVLVGHMSLVGPRPSPFRENQICVSWREARLSVRPGITGLWQVCRDADRSQGGFHEWIYYDLAYVRNQSFWLDIKILVATILTGGRWRLPVSWFIKE